jgi:ribonuclease VapC
MIIDTSVIIAIVLREDGYERLVEAIALDPAPKVSAGSYLEASIVLRNRLPKSGHSVLDQVIQKLNLEIVAFSRTEAIAASVGHLRFGRGSHPAALNFGDCISYGTAIVRNEPLLFIGKDFAQTDVPRNSE